MKRNRRLAIGIGVGLVLVLAAVGAWADHTYGAYARIGSNYLADQYCACVFVAGRTSGSCHAEFMPDIGKFTVSEDRSGLPNRAAVKTRLLVFSGEATYERGYGCHLSR